MVRIYKRKTDRGKYGGEKLKSALNALKDQPLKQVSRQYGIPARTLRRHRDLKVKYSGVVVLGPKQPVLSHDVERLLIQHITHMERSLYGLSTVDVRRLAFELAERLGIKHNFKSESKMAGRDWLQGHFQSSSRYSYPHSAEVLTSSPYKSRLVEIAEKKTKKTVKELRPAKMITKGKGQSSGKGKGKAKPRPRKKQRCEMSSSEDEEWPCLICGEPFENSRPREVWVQCHDCKKWAHRDCTEGQDCFICPNCDSDSD
ncbi:PHD finger protein ALFIN-LIKE 7-like [Gigantopelta aegis]|uniref:PHD finger protein ALFIN-LIKE 7-like n=1 Tax=Gigantopelta aegis TaxID=1735272 RepID=UPI001B88B152|nr:PHD finger protein ALFIN-LIKE 7-like [Gigantopelta aegis]